MAACSTSTRQLAFTLLEIMLGSSLSSESLALDRNLTTIEINILKNTMTSICNELQKAMPPGGRTCSRA